nr:hypothetical protein [Methylobacterium sp. ZNC0032]
MRSFYVNVPFIGEAFVEVGGITRPRQGFFDAAKNAGCVELWAGSMHLTLDAPRKRPSLIFALALAGVALFVEPPVEFKLIDWLTFSAADKEQIATAMVVALEITYPSTQ